MTGSVVVEGNTIGTTADGTGALGNAGDGILLANGAQFDVIDSNVISANLGNGVDIDAPLGGIPLPPPPPPTSFNIVTGNFIGTNAAGTGPLGNQGNGVLINGESNNTIGGTASGAANTIAYNTGAGVAVVGATATGNPIRGNSLHDNTGLGIDLGADGASLNDAGDGDSGPNNLQNFPVLVTSLVGTSTQLTGTFNSQANAAYTLDFYASAAADPTGYGEGQRYLGSSTVTTDGSGNASFNLTLAAATVANEQLTATATDAAGNTSEFSADLFANAAPSATIVGAPATGPEGTAINLTSTVTDVNFSQGDTVTYAWSVTKNGNPYATGSAAGFSFTPDDNASYVVTLVTTDSQNATGTDSKTITVTNVTPANVSISAPAINENDMATLTGSFTDPGTLDTHTVVIHWGDGSADSTLNLAAHVLTFSATHQYLDNPASPATTFAISATVTDKDGASGLGSTTVAVANVAPSHLALSVLPSVINENGTTTLSGSFTDPGTLDKHTVTIEWGDGSVNTADIQTFNLAAGVLTFSGITHQYLDNPTGQPNFVISATVTDSDGATSAPATASVEVDNVAPTIASVASPDQVPNQPLIFAGVRGQPLTFTLRANDPSPVDQAAGFTYTINWGDGTLAQPDIQVISATAGNGAGAAVTHDYVQGAATPYHFTVTATDKDGGVSTIVTASVQINAYAVLNGGTTLAVGAATTGSNIILSQTAPGAAVHVVLEDLSAPTFTSDQPFLSGNVPATPQTTLYSLDGGYAAAGDHLVVITGNTTNETPFTINLAVTAATTLGDLLNALNQPAFGIQASLDSQGHLVVVRLDGPSTALNLGTQLPFVSGNSPATTQTLLNNLDGIVTPYVVGDNLVITGSTAQNQFSITLPVTPTTTLGDVLNAVNSQAGLGVHASLDSFGELVSSSALTITNAAGNKGQVRWSSYNLPWSNYNLTEELQSVVSHQEYDIPSAGLQIVKAFGQHSDDYLSADGVYINSLLNSGGGSDVMIGSSHGAQSDIEKPAGGSQTTDQIIIVMGTGQTTSNVAPGSDTVLIDRGGYNTLNFSNAVQGINLNLGMAANALTAPNLTSATALRAQLSQDMAAQSTQTVDVRGDKLTLVGNFQQVVDSPNNDTIIAPLPKTDGSGQLVARAVTIVSNQGQDTLFGTLGTTVDIGSSGSTYVGLLQPSAVSSALDQLQAAQESSDIKTVVVKGQNAFQTAISAGFNDTLLAQFANQLSSSFSLAQLGQFQNQVTVSGNNNLALGGILTNMKVTGNGNAFIGVVDGTAQSFLNTAQASFQSSLAAAFNTALSSSFANSLSQGFNSTLNSGFSSALNASFTGALQSSFANSLSGSFATTLGGSFQGGLAGSFSSGLQAAFQNALGSGFNSTIAAAFNTVLNQGFASTLQGAFNSTLTASFSGALQTAYNGALQSAFNSVLAQGFNNILDGAFANTLGQSFQTALSGSFNSGLLAGFVSGLQASFGGALQSSFATALGSSFNNTIQAAFQSALNGSLSNTLQGSLRNALQASFGSTLQGSFNQALAASFATTLGSSFGSTLNGSFATALNGAFATALNGGFAGTLGAGFANNLQSSFNTQMNAAFAGTLGAGFVSTLSGAFQGVLNGGFANILQSAFQSTLSGSFGTALQDGYNSALQSAFSTALSGGFSNVLGGSFATSLQQAFQTSLTQSFNSGLLASFTSALAASFNNQLTASFAGTLGGSFNAAQQASFQSALGGSFRSTLASGLQTALNQSFNSTLQNSFSGSLASSFAVALVGAFRSNVTVSGSNNFAQAGLLTNLTLNGTNNVFASTVSDSSKDMVLNSLTAFTNSTVGTSFSGAIQSSFAAALNGSFASTLGSSFQSTLGSSFASGLQAAFQAALGSSYTPTVASAFSTVLGQGFASALQAAFSSTLTASFTSALQSSYNSALQSAFQSALNGGFANVLHGGYLSALQSGFQSALSGSFSSGLMASFVTALQTSFGGALPGELCQRTRSKLQLGGAQPGSLPASPERELEHHPPGGAAERVASKLRLNPSRGLPPGPDAELRLEHGSVVCQHAEQRLREHVER